MLEIIRAYGQDRLTEMGEADELRRAHARHFTQLAEVSMDYLLGAQQLDWLRKLSEDQDNLHGAIRGAIAAGDGQAAVGLAGALGWYWSLRSMKVEGAELIAMALEVPRGPAETGRERLAVAYAMGGLLAMDTPLIDRVQDWFTAAADLAAAIPDSREPVLRLIGPLRALFGAFATGQRMPLPAVFDKAVADPEPWVRGAALVLRGHVTVNCGLQHVQAEEDFLAATGIFTGLGERWGMALALGGLAMLEGWRGEHAAAASHYRQAVALVTELGSTEDEIMFRLCLTRELWLLGERQVAHAELVRAQRDAERLRLPEVIALGAYTAGDLARLEGRPEAARAALRRVVEQDGPRDMAQLIRAQAATGLGYLAAADGDLEAARGWHSRALDAARSSSDAPVIAQALTGLADLSLREDAPDRAAELLGASLAVRGTTDRSVLDEKRVAHAVRAMLGDARYADAYQRGQRVTIDTLATLIELTPGA
jgi:hypothetical protein